MMRLSSTVREFKNVIGCLLLFYILGMSMLTPTSAYNLVNGNNPANDNLLLSNLEKEIITTIVSQENSDFTSRIDIKKDVRPEESGSPYYSVSQTSSTSNNLSARDVLSVNQYDVFNLTNFEDTGKINNSYSITNIADYTNDSLNYGITELKSIDDNYTVEDEYDGVVKFDKDDYYTFAQAFDVVWDYAFFYGSKLYLNYDTGSMESLEEYELSLHLVSENITDGKPNMSNIISNCTLNPFSQSNRYIDVGGFQFFDFTDVRLTKGTYYIVANLSQIDTGSDAERHFQWAKNDHSSDGVDDGETLLRSTIFSGWSSSLAYDLTLINYLYPVDSNNDSIIFTGTDEIDLKDNNINVTTTTSSINSTGIHELSANTSVQISFNNSYVFSKVYSGNDIDAVFTASNGSYWSYDVSWNITWTSNEIDYSPYSNLNRTQKIVAPTDWDSTFTFYYNETDPFTAKRESYGYIILLNDNNTAGDWRLTTKSPNYIEQLSLLDGLTETDRYFLGYWTANITYATGYNGSTITSEAFVKNDGGGTPTLETTGTLNYTLFDCNGNIVPLKSSIDANLSFTDLTSYSYTGLVNDSAGFYSNNITFDPSVYNSDLPGFWTAMVFWQNGTEVGFYTIRIVVQTQTYFDAEWEIIPSSNTWTNADISRINLDEIAVKAYYYNISEPFFSGNGTIIPTANVSYTTTWLDDGIFTDLAPQYTTSITVNTVAGSYSVNFLATGAFIENQTISFNVDVFYELGIDPENNADSIKYTDNAIYSLCIVDESSISNLSSYTNLYVSVYNQTDNFNLIINTDYTFTYQGPSELWLLDVDTSTNDLAIGNYNISISLNIPNYQASYTQINATVIYDLTINAPTTAITSQTSDLNIYVDHTKTSFSFKYTDTDHAVDLITDGFAVYSNISSGVILNIYRVSDTYYIDVTLTDPSIIGIEVKLNITLSNYQTIEEFTLGIIHVNTISTSLEEMTDETPENSFIGYNTTVVVRFNDTTHIEFIDTGEITLFLINSSDYIFLDIISLGNGEYNVTFINNDYTVEWLNITITLSKDGYFASTVSILIQLQFIYTDGEFIGDSDSTIYYDTGESYQIIYWDDVSLVNITSPDVFFSGNLMTIATPSVAYNGNITIITIANIQTLGRYELVIVVVEPGYLSQEYTVYITIVERETSIDITDPPSTIIDTYATDTVTVWLNFTDLVDIELIENANIAYILAGDNSSLNVNLYFDIQSGIITGTIYEIIFDPIAQNVTYWFVFEITLSKYGYNNQTILIEIRVNIQPTSIGISSDVDITIYFDEEGTFEIFYLDEALNSISDASIDILLINGTGEITPSLPGSQPSDRYYVIFTPISASTAGNVYEIQLTFYKVGYINQTWTVYLHVIIHPTSIGASSDTDISIYVDEEGIFRIQYLDEAFNNISGASIDILLINGTGEITPSLPGSQPSEWYNVIVTPMSASTAGYTYQIQLTFYKDGYTNQTWTVYLHVIIHPTSIGTSSDVEIVIYGDEEGTFEIYYFDEVLSSISGATLDVLLVNGTDELTVTIPDPQPLDRYYVLIAPLEATCAGNTYQIQITFSKPGFETRIWTIYLHVIIRPTSIGISSDVEITIYADEEGRFEIYYFDNEMSSISGATLEVLLINGTDELTVTIPDPQPLDRYYVLIDPLDAFGAGNVYHIQITFSKDGCESQIWNVYLHIYPKLEYEIIIVVDGDVRELEEIQFTVTMQNLTTELITSMSGEGKLVPEPSEGEMIVFVIFYNGDELIWEGNQTMTFTGSGGTLVWQSADFLIDKGVSRVEYYVEFQPDNPDITSTTTTSAESSITSSPAFGKLIKWLFTEFTPYMIAGLAVIAIVFVSFTVYLAVIRPKKQKEHSKKKQYLDKVSKTLSSVISMKKLIVVYSEAGVPVFEYNITGESTVDSSLVTGLLQAVSGMGIEISGGTAKGVRKLDYGDFVVSCAASEHYATYLFTTGEISKDIMQGLAIFIEWFEKRFKHLTDIWDGNLDEINDKKGQIDDKIAEDLFIWTLHPLSLNPMKTEKDFTKLGQYSQNIINFVKTTKGVTIGLILEYFAKYPKEETVMLTFALVEDMYLLRKRFR